MFTDYRKSTKTPLVTTRNCRYTLDDRYTPDSLFNPAYEISRTAFVNNKTKYNLTG